MTTQIKEKTAEEKERATAWGRFLDVFDKAVVVRQGLLKACAPSIFDPDLVIPISAKPIAARENDVLLTMLTDSALEFPEAFTISGKMADGSPFLSRLRVGAPESPSCNADMLFGYQERRADKMNALGADVVVLHEKVDTDTLKWESVT